MKCERCKSNTQVHMMSMFNTQMICLNCKDIESKHPQYQTAVDREREEVMKGNMNFIGIGLPTNL